jgi:hypothetical protein
MVSILALTGCAVAPAWVRQRQFVCEVTTCPRTFSGVGVVGGAAAPTPALRRSLADARAREAVAHQILTSVRREAADSFSVLVAGTLLGMQIADHWVADDGAEYSLAVASCETFVASLQTRPDVTAEQRALFAKQCPVRLAP